MPKHNAVLTDEIVMKLRAEVRANRFMNLRGYAKQYSVSHPTIQYALVGKTFSHIPDPILPDETTRTRNGRQSIMTPEQIDSIVALRRENPTYYSYATLAERCNTLYGCRYGPSNVKRLIERATNEKIDRPANAKPKQARAAAPRVRKAAPVSVVPPVVIPAGLKVVDISTSEARAAFAAKFLAMRAKSC